MASAQIEGAALELQAATLQLMAVPELQLQCKDQALYLEDKREGTWHVRTIMGNGLLELTQSSGTSPIVRRRVATIDEVLAWNDLNFVPDQASGVRIKPAEPLKA